MLDITFAGERAWATEAFWRVMATFGFWRRLGIVFAEKIFAKSRTMILRYL